MSTFDINHVRDKLHKHQYIVKRIHQISGAPGLAIGVSHKGHLIYENYRGLRDVERNLAVDNDTIFHVASLTKAITAAAIGILVDQGKLEWDKPVEELLSFFKENQSEKSKLIVADFLSHRTGTTWGDALYLQSNNNIMLEKAECLRTFQYLPTVAEPRSQFLYNNHAFNVPGFIIEKLSNMSYGVFLKSNLFDPLEMSRTFTENPKDSNVAAPYNILTDGTPFRIPFSEASTDTMMFSAISVRTSMTDPLRLYGAILNRIHPLVPGKQEGMTTEAKGLRSWFSRIGWASSPIQTTSHGERDTPTAVPDALSPIRQPKQLYRSYITRNSDTLYEQSSALGWMR